MRSLSLLGLLAVLLSTAASAAVKGSGVKLTQTREVAAFTAIEASGGVQLDVKRGPVSVVLEGDDNLLPLITTEVRDGALIIRRKHDVSISPTLELVARVTLPALSRLEASGGVKASLDGVAAPKFAAELSGGVELHAPKLALESFTLEASGGVTAELSGTAQQARFDLSGGVKLRAKDLTAARVTVGASGGCDLDLTATESVSGEASGGVGVTVHGKPKKAGVDTSGGASVRYVD